MSGDDLNMEGQPIDRGIGLASLVVHERATARPDFAGLWLDTGAREIHVASLDERHHCRPQGEVSPEIRLRRHKFEHPMSALEAVGRATSDYLDREGY
jgi:hypothetical protein